MNKPLANIRMLALSASLLAGSARAPAQNAQPTGSPAGPPPDSGAPVSRTRPIVRLT